MQLPTEFHITFPYGRYFGRKVKQQHCFVARWLICAASAQPGTHNRNCGRGAFRQVADVRKDMRQPGALRCMHSDSEMVMCSPKWSARPRAIPFATKQSRRSEL